MPINAATDAITLDNLEQLTGMVQKSVNPPMKKMETRLGDMHLISIGASLCWASVT